MSAARDDVFVKEKEILVGVSLLFSSIWPKKSLKNGVQNVRGSDRMLSLFFRVRTNRILSIAECRRFFLLLFKMIKSRCVRIRYFRLALVSGGNIGFSMGQKLHFDFMSGGDGQGRVLWLCGWR